MKDLLTSVTTEGKEYYYMCIHPRTHYLLKVLSARAKYKHRRWIPRWEGWSGKEYIEVEGELGVFSR